jgi:hypothetical protein
MRSFLGRTFGGVSSKAQCLQARLSPSMGELRLTHIARRSSAAFIGSRGVSAGVVSDIVPEISCPLDPDPALHPGLDHYRAQLCPDYESPPIISSAPTQASLTLPLQHGALETLMATAVCTIRFAYIRSLFRRPTRLLSIPYKLSLQLRPAEFHQATRNRIGVTHHNDEQDNSVFENADGRKIPGPQFCIRRILDPVPRSLFFAPPV